MFFSRRALLRQSACGFGLLGLRSMLAAPADSPLAPRVPHFAARAKRVIFLFMHGGPSSIDTFDPKERLERDNGKPVPFKRGLTFGEDSVRGLMKAQWPFQKYGQSGLPVSDLFPHVRTCVDDLCVVRSMVGDGVDHGAALLQLHTGVFSFKRPSMGSWVLYGLGTENQNLPAYVVLDDPKGPPINFIQNWQAGWLPAVYQGTRVRSEGSPILNLHAKQEYPGGVLDASRSLLHRMDKAHLERHPGNVELAARISNYELAARMQMEATDALDLTKESDATKEAYGLNEEKTASYGRRCLMARRLVERGVRLVQIYIEGQIWDNHNKIRQGLEYSCGKTDRPAAALVRDLKERGLLDSTLVVWGGEFGRLPIAQDPGPNAGRDHGPSGFSIWMAGGGVKGGMAYGSTDEIGYRAAENKVSVHDFHATVLHQLGLNHRDLTIEREGRNERITDEFPARVVSEILS